MADRTTHSRPMLSIPPDERTVDGAGLLLHRLARHQEEILYAKGRSRKSAVLDKDSEDYVFALATGDPRVFVRELAKTVLVNGVMPMVMQESARYAPKTYCTDDRREELYAIALEGVAKAIGRYNPQYQDNSRLSHIAVWYIKESLQKNVPATRSLVRLPNSPAYRFLRTHFQAALNHVRTENPALTDHDMPERVAAFLTDHPKKAPSVRINARDVENYYKTMHGTAEIPLDAPLGTSDTLTLAGVLPDTSPSPADQTEEESKAAFMRAALDKGLSQLSEREQRIITARHFCSDEDAATLEDLGQEFNVSRERIRQIEKKAMEKLTAALAVDPDSKSRLLDLIAD